MNSNATQSVNISHFKIFAVYYFLTFKWQLLKLYYNFFIYTMIQNNNNLSQIAEKTNLVQNNFGTYTAHVSMKLIIEHSEDKY